MSIQLYGYQQKAADAILSCFDAGNTALVVLPCGAGKSILIAATARERLQLDPSSRILALVHNQELVQQNHDSFLRFGDEFHASIYCAGLKSKCLRGQVVFATPQSLVKAKGELNFDTVLVDEAHHLQLERSSAVYTRLLARINYARLAGFTATPHRMDAGYIARCNPFNGITHESTVMDLLGEDRLAPIEVRSTLSEYDTTKVARVGDDYNKKQLAAVVDDDETLRAIITEDLPRLAGRKSVLVSCATVVQAKRIVKLLHEANQTAISVQDKMKPEDRQRALAGFRNGFIRFLAVVDIATEGFDAPATDAIMLLRPTLSLSKHAQILGRGGRKAPGKVNCVVLDHTNNTKHHGHPHLINYDQPPAKKASGASAPGAAPPRVWVCKCSVLNPVADAFCRCGEAQPSRAVLLNVKPADVAPPPRPIKVTAPQFVRCDHNIRFLPKGTPVWSSYDPSPFDMATQDFLLEPSNMFTRWTTWGDRGPNQLTTWTQIDVEVPCPRGHRNPYQELMIIVTTHDHHKRQVRLDFNGQDAARRVHALRHIDRPAPEGHRIVFRIELESNSRYGFAVPVFVRLGTTAY